MIRSIPLTALSFTLGFFFIFVGFLKISPNINPEMHEEMKREFGRYNKIFPLYSITGWRPLAKNYRLTVGYVELICGSILILIPGAAKELANLILMATMVGGFMTHYLLGDKFEKCVPALVFGILLLARLVISYQVDKRERLEYEKKLSNELKNEQGNKENEKDDGGSNKKDD